MGRASIGAMIKAAASKLRTLERRDIVISPWVGARQRQYLPVSPHYMGVVIKTQDRDIGCKPRFKPPWLSECNDSNNNVRTVLHWLLWICTGVTECSRSRNKWVIAIAGSVIWRELA